ncbi:autotransporter domain-containing protein [Pseudomonas abietaniphila]|uniref:autotransporter domain-containing protein n=1 Tax=Pseudomonas abietaniphila TaxID=89065 RepID=UPI0032162F26
MNVTFNDNGNNAGNSNPAGADSVILRNPTTFAAYYDYRSNTGSAGNHTGSASSAQLSAGLFISVKAGTYLGPVTISCSSAASSDATLSSLIPSTGTLSPTFSSGTDSYNVAVPNSVATIAFTPTARDSNATITVNGNTVASGAASPAISLSEGANAVSVVGTAQDNTTHTYSITVTRAVSPPIANAVSSTVAANSSSNPITLSTSGGSPVSVAIASGPVHGTASASGTSISYTPMAGYSGTDSFTYTASNGSGTSSAATISITVTAPVLVMTPASGTLSAGQVGTAYNQSFAAAGGTAPYGYVGSVVPAGLSLDSATGSLSGVPTSAGTYSFSVTATDSHGATGSANYTLTVAAGALPVANPVSLTVAANSSNAVSLSLSGGTATSVAVSSAPTHGTAVASGTSITYTPTAGYSGADSFTYTASNASGTSSPATVMLTVTAPTLTLAPSAGALPAGQVGSAYNQSFHASGGNAPYRYVSAGYPTGMTFDSSTGALSGTPSSPGTFTLSVTVTDNHGATGNATYTLNVASAQAPVAGPVSATVSADSASPLTLSLSGAAATSVAVASAPAHGSAVASGTSIIYTPTAGYSGTDSFTYTASNATGTSSAATVNITVTAPTLSVLPASGALPAASIGASYSQSVNVSGGTAPYHFTATGLPAGLNIDPSTGTISGTPSAASSASISVAVTDAFGVSATMSYSLVIGGSTPSGADRSASLLAGQSVTVNLSDAVNGGPFTSAALVNTPPRSVGQTTLNGLNLTFLASAQASGAVVIRYTVSNRWGTSQPISLTLQVTGRSDPSKDQEVIGMLAAQAQSATRFARAQIDNFNDRLEQLHDNDSRRNRSFNLQLGLPQSRQSRTDSTSAAQMYQALSTLKASSAPATPQQASSEKDADWFGDGNISVWSGGYVNVSDAHRDDVKLDSTMVGISVGADYLFLDSFTAGIGFGYGRDSSDIGSQNSRSKGDSFSTALYGSFHPGQIFVDGLLGYSSLSFDSRRYVTDTGGYARGSRDGDQYFASLSSGYEFRDASWRLAPYGRMDVSSTELDGFRETGSGSFDLAYADQRLTVLSGVGGLRGQYGIPLAHAAMTLRGRVEYSHTFSGDSTARVGYADISDSTYSISTIGQSENTMTLAMGVDFALKSGVTTGVTYQGSYGMGDDSRSNALMFRVGTHF